MFNNVLIANRGEIALRIIRACKELDIKTTIIYSTQDKDALAVKFADKAYNIGSKAKDYLNYEKIIKIAKKSKSDAIHPGYGFLAENSKFTRLCEKNKIKFIGPSPKSMELMGNKDTARKTTQKLGIPLLIGTDALKDEGHALNSAEDIGYPVIIKAVAGGGGKGMRIVRKRKDIESAFKSAQSEAESAFGNKEVYMEKYLDDPSHIEFQILADKSGNAIHLGERECSIQRRHQKLIEEAPSPLLNSELREKIGEAAIKIVKEVKYEGAGTVEFLLDKNKNFYFMEMNTRIQVEHGITEMVTGVDLIKEQIKIAAGAKLAYKQKDIRIDGSAIECRINAECPAEDFCPKTGTIINYLPPGGPGIRVCSSCHAGHVVSPHYDSLISKLMCKGSTRQEAISRMQRALEEFIIEGVDTTIPFHKAVLDSKAFLKGKLTTNFIEKYHILDKLKSEKPKKNGLTKKEKILIVTTAVAKHLDNNSNNKQSAWASAAKYESANNFEENV
ncbi:MAG: acetyl-CoA carboxylase biotin carboxylase subunit [Nanoarchaeota archaeon]|nr:acetyl-CoA carboxylase biotin carboxylase subunit [Nanoarchaeota archaeon]MBU1004636.1 acetyl-CoA carboxylase biotin carboxylase subunit [Nanoarchaeota archaeon]MBU1946190.1 acetyl-CoA carboxylase biotin carboxylase subunit [Nanoarchaeota archaeon]